MVPQTLSRREALSALSCGFGGLALNALAQNESGKQGPFSGPTFHHAPKAKRVIFIFMAGGVSHVDSYDYKENLYKHDGKMMRFDDARTLAKTRKIIEHRVMKPLWKFKQYGQSGQHVSELSRTLPPPCPPLLPPHSWWLYYALAYTFKSELF